MCEVFSDSVLICVLCVWVAGYKMVSFILTYTSSWLHNNFIHTSHRTSRMFEVVSMCEGCCEVFGEVY